VTATARCSSLARAGLVLKDSLFPRRRNFVFQVVLQSFLTRRFATSSSLQFSPLLSLPPQVASLIQGTVLVLSAFICNAIIENCFPYCFFAFICCLFFGLYVHIFTYIWCLFDLPTSLERSCLHGATENAGPSKMQRWKMRDWKTQDHYTWGGKRKTKCYGTPKLHKESKKDEAFIAQ